MKSSPIFILTFALSAFAGDVSDGHHDAYGPLYTVAPQLDSAIRQGRRKGLDAVRRWNQITIDASGLDHTPPAIGENRVWKEQLGPGRASRAMAIVHIAMFDTVTAVLGEYQSYTGVHVAPGIALLFAEHRGNGVEHRDMNDRHGSTRSTRSKLFFPDPIFADRRRGVVETARINRDLIPSPHRVETFTPPLS